VLKPVMANSP